MSGIREWNRQNQMTVSPSGACAHGRTRSCLARCALSRTPPTDVAWSFGVSSELHSPASWLIYVGVGSTCPLSARCTDPHDARVYEAYDWGEKCSGFTVFDVDAKTVVSVVWTSWPPTCCAVALVVFSASASSCHSGAQTLHAPASGTTIGRASCKRSKSRERA